MNTVNKIYSFSLKGIEAILVDVEVDIRGSNIPKFDIIGLPDTAIKEAKERVRSALINNKLNFPFMRILVNLAPADIRKEGPHYDLAIAIGILSQTAQIKLDDKIAFVGELALDGAIRPVKGIISMVYTSYKLGIKHIFVPKANADESCFLGGDINIFAVSHIKDVIIILKNFDKAIPYSYNNLNNYRKIDEEYSKLEIDYKEVKGQEYAKRALLISAAGKHHCLMIGPPGAGKSMLAQRLITILPKLTLEESIETSRIYSIVGNLPNKELIKIPPFRAPHHTISYAGMVGGGCNPKPGEISLANNGVLFLDELPEFSRSTLQILRQPLETGKVIISRAKETVSYPAKFLLIGAMNPCPCGYYGDSMKECRCNRREIHKYRKKISGPLLDRFDIQLEINRISYKDLVKPNESGLSSLEMFKKVKIAREIQWERFFYYKISTNSEMSPNLINKFCKINKDSQLILKDAIDKFGLSARAYHKILKISRTIADIEECKNIETSHIIEAIQYRKLDKSDFF